MSPELITGSSSNSTQISKKKKQNKNKKTKTSTKIQENTIILEPIQNPKPVIPVIPVPPPLPAKWFQPKDQIKNNFPNPPPLPNNWFPIKPSALRRYSAPVIHILEEEEQQQQQHHHQQAILPIPPPPPIPQWVKNVIPAPPVSTEPITCPVCWEEVVGNSVVRIMGCNHEYCLECVRDHFTVLVFNGRAKKMTCLSPGCQVIPTDVQIQQIVTPNTFIKFQAFRGRMNQVTSNPECRWCPRAGCETPILREDQNQKKLVCDSEGCGTEFCFDCRLEWHEGFTCEENKKNKGENWEDSWKQENNAQNCPNCGILSQRIDGCDWIKCLVCAHEFCWACLEPHDHNMSAHIHGPRYKFPKDEPYHNYYNNNNDNNYYQDQRRRRRNKRIKKGIAIAALAPVLGPIALAGGLVAGCALAIGAPFYYGHKKAKKEYELMKQRRRTGYYR